MNDSVADLKVESNVNLRLVPLAWPLAVCRLDPKEGFPDWATGSRFFSITRTDDELSVVCEESAVPPEPGFKVEPGWRGLRVAGRMAFDVIGVLAALTSPLAAGNIGVFAISTFDTDYLLVKGPDLDRAVAALRAAGHTVADRETSA